MRIPAEAAGLDVVESEEESVLEEESSESESMRSVVGSERVSRFWGWFFFF